ncbi:dimethyladenosine transferase 2, mitochondrial-like [Anthonomus grandis grandis]|uniref:dimethyladenosine transferase 2, mitochondrial-like n=1 Tax=Anthonomus grandis grandis TaxID=2921223 RepID=UPI002165F32D|nr:dimethyladenosine transferase 2, mitochondrial-like [Anthonomus grandis grandis]
MAVNSYFYKLRQLKTFKNCRLWSTSFANSELNPDNPDFEENSEVNQPSTARLTRHVREINAFFEQHPDFQHLKRWVPKKVLETRPYKSPEHIYLVCPKIATSVARHIKQRIQGVTFIGESNAGFGLITKALLNEGVSSPIRIYESLPEFQQYLNESFKNEDRVILYPKDFFSLRKHASIDRLNCSSTVSEMIEGISMRTWRDEPAITLVGTLTNNTFLKYLIRCLILQREPITYGRIDLFLITPLNQWQIYTATSDNVYRQYKAVSTLLQTFFDMELIDKYPRKYFLPWQNHSKKSRGKKDPSNFEEVCLMRMTMKKDFPITADHFLPYYSFISFLYARGSGSIISTCEKYIPNSGQSLIVPKLPHEDYFEDINIFTKFKELTPKQLISLYKELAAHEHFDSSPFMDMVEQELVKSETIDSDLHEYNTKHK